MHDQYESGYLGRVASSLKPQDYANPYACAYGC